MGSQNAGLGNISSSSRHVQISNSIKSLLNINLSIIAFRPQLVTLLLYVETVAYGITLEHCALRNLAVLFAIGLICNVGPHFLLYNGDCWETRT